MSFYISIVGIDGSGKTMVTLALANLIAADLELTTVAIGEDIWGKTSEEDLFRPGFLPDGKPLVARLDRLLRKGARAATYHRKLYPHLKVAQLAMQEQTAKQLDTNYHPDVILGDSNLLLTSGAWAINYINSRSNPVSASSVDPLTYIETLYDYIVTGDPLPPEIAQPISGLKLMRWLYRLDQRLNLGFTNLPDALIYLDISPEKALARVMARDTRPDGHENIHDMIQAKTMFQGVVEFFRRQQGYNNTAVIDVTQLSREQTLGQVVDFVRNLPLPQPADKPLPPTQKRLGTASTKLSDTRVVAMKALTFQYLIRYLLPNLHHGSAYELTFPLSQLGQLSLKEGYSARLMKAIYLQDNQKYGLLDRIFLNHPLHRAVYHRLQVLKQWVEKEFCCRLEKLPHGKTIKVITAPSGYAFDLLYPLKQIAKSHRENIKPIQILASDIDPDGCIERELTQVAQETGLNLEFVQGDLTSAEMREQFKQLGPYDVVVFIGLSSWVSKAQLVNHLKLIRSHLLAPDGTLFTDCFTPQISALTGKYVGYKANYYDPTEFTSLLAYSGFDPANITWENGPDGIDHVCIAKL